MFLVLAANFVVNFVAANFVVNFVAANFVVVNFVAANFVVKFLDLKFCDCGLKFSSSCLAYSCILALLCVC